MNHHTKLTLPERKLIARWLGEEASFRECARRLGCSHSTVSREIKRNRFREDIYEPLHAQNKAEKRKSYAWKAKHPLKNADVYAYVTERLRWGWSPEVIAGRLREVKHSGDPHWKICHETIYRFCYHPRFQKEGLSWWEYLESKNKEKEGNKREDQLREQESPIASLSISDQKRSIKEPSLATGKEIP